jgi:hypothetical protein
MPIEQQRYCVQWQKEFKDYTLWTDSAWDIFGGFELWNNKLNLVNIHPGITSDILRALIVNKFGGMYVDTDVELIKSPKELLENCSFLCGFEKAPIIMGGVFASIQNSNILNKIVANFKPAGDVLERIGWKLFNRSVIAELDQNCTVLGQNVSNKYWVHHNACSWCKK